MIGAIAGDIIGSIYEHHPIKTKDFPLLQEGCEFTDDTVLTVAVAHSILRKRDYADSLRRFARRHPTAGYGGSFARWAQAEHAPAYRSWGNGSAMRVSPVGFAFATEEEVLAEARMSAEVTHNHPEGIKGAQAVALAVFLARTGRTKPCIQATIQGRFGYELATPLSGIRPHYRFDVSCQGTVPAALVAFLESSSYEDAVRNAISLGGDSDTLACITGGIAEAFYGGVPPEIRAEIDELLPPDLFEVIEEFRLKHTT